MSTTPHPDPSDRTEPLTQPISTTGGYAGSTGGSGTAGATSPLGVPAYTSTPGGTAHAVREAKDTDERREPRVATIVWGLILVAVAAGILAVAQGYRIDAELALIVGLGAAGLLLLAGSLATAARRRRRSSHPDAPR